jgi:hypothetical protein
MFPSNLGNKETKSEKRWKEWVKRRTDTLDVRNVEKNA